MEEQQKQITLADLNIVQLKAIAYDEYIKLNVSQNNLRVIKEVLILIHIYEYFLFTS